MNGETKDLINLIGCYICFVLDTLLQFYNTVTNKLGKLFLQLSDTSLAGIVVDNHIKDRTVYLQGTAVQGILLHDTRQKVALRNLFFLLKDITAKVNNLHTVKQCWLNIRKIIGGGYKKDTRKVIIHTEIVVMETTILFWV